MIFQIFINISFLFFYFFFGFEFSFAQAQKKINLKEALSIFLKRNIEYQNLKKNLSIESQNLKKNKSTYSFLAPPQVDLELSYRFSGNYPISLKEEEEEEEKKINFLTDPDFFPDISEKKWEKHYFGTSFHINKVLYDFGTAQGLLKVSNAAYDIQYLSFLKDLNSLIRQLYKKFYFVLFQYKIFNFYEKKMKFQKDLFEKNEILYKQSSLTKDIYLKMKIELQNFQNLYREKKYQALRAVNELLYFLRMPQVENIKDLQYEFEGNLDDFYLPYFEEDLQSNLESLVKNFYPQDKKIQNISFYDKDSLFFKKLQKAEFKEEELSQRALLFNFDLLKLKTQKKVLEGEQVISISGLKPKILFYSNLDLGFSNKDIAFKEDFKSSLNYNLGLSFKIPFMEIINPTSASYQNYKISQKKIELISEKIELLKEKIKTNLIHTYRFYKKTLEDLNSKKEILSFAKEYYNLRFKEYQKGIKSYLDYEKAWVDYLNYQLQYYQGQFEMKETYFKLLDFLGT